MPSASCGAGGAHEGHACLPDPADAAGGHSHDEGIGRDVTGDDRSGADHCPGSDAHRGHAHGARADRRSAPDAHADGFPVRARLQGALRRDRAGAVIIREDRCGSHKNAVGQRGGLVDERVVLDLAARADAHPLANVGAAPDDGFLPDLGSLAHLGEVPHAGTAGDLRARRDVGTGFDHGFPLGFAGAPACPRRALAAR